jgi:hypothetical protein
MGVVGWKPGFSTKKIRVQMTLLAPLQWLRLIY